MHDVAERQLAVEKRADHQLKPCRHAVATLGVFNVLVDGLVADPKQLSCMPVTFAGCCEHDAIELAWRESRQRRDLFAGL